MLGIIAPIPQKVHKRHMRYVENLPAAARLWPVLARIFLNHLFIQSGDVIVPQVKHQGAGLRFSAAL